MIPDILVKSNIQVSLFYRNRSLWDLVSNTPSQVGEYRSCIPSLEISSWNFVQLRPFVSTSASWPLVETYGCKLIRYPIFPL